LHAGSGLDRMSYVDFVTPAVEHAKAAAQFDENHEYDQVPNCTFRGLFLHILHISSNLEPWIPSFPFIFFITGRFCFHCYCCGCCCRIVWIQVPSLQVPLLLLFFYFVPFFLLQAYKAYMKAIEFFMTAVKHEKVPKKKEMLRSKVRPKYVL
jgi:hypothetical protein